MYVYDMQNELENIGRRNHNGYGFNMHATEFELKHTHIRCQQFLSQMKKQFISILSENPPVRLAIQIHFVFWLLMELEKRIQPKKNQQTMKKHFAAIKNSIIALTYRPGPEFPMSQRDACAQLQFF